MILVGRSAIVTGGSQGLGRAIVEEFVRQGANVLFCARNDQLSMATLEYVRELATPSQKVLAFRCDVSKPSEVDGLFDLAAREFGAFEILVNNAGVYGPKGPTESVPWGEWARAVEINLFGTVLAARGAIPTFRRAEYGKIINLSGGGATGPLPRLSAYAASKAAVVRLTETLAEELRPFRIDVNAVAPGALNTRLLDEVLDAGPDLVGEQFFARALEQKKAGGASLADGASLCAYLASASSDGITGKLISAQWDPWARLHEHREAINKTDIYTLRRIVPEDRGQTWDD
jgi:NAD(P)-dependent dehydrogenase (short-subunit alcohol dehydrogenase family)